MVDVEAAAGRTPAETRGSLARYVREGARLPTPPAQPPRTGGRGRCENG